MYQLARNKTANPESTCQRAMGDDFASTTSLLGLADTIRRMDDHSPLVVSTLLVCSYWSRASPDRTTNMPGAVPT
jgi:hypothetical protein